MPETPAQALTVVPEALACPLRSVVLMLMVACRLLVLVLRTLVPRTWAVGVVLTSLAVACCARKLDHHELRLHLNGWPRPVAHLKVRARIVQTNAQLAHEAGTQAETGPC